MGCVERGSVIAFPFGLHLSFTALLC
jgi:hypothetical protein